MAKKDDKTAGPQRGRAADVVDLGQARAQRQRRRLEQEAGQRDRTRRLFEMQQDLHGKVLRYVLRSGRMWQSDLMDMIKLGIVTDEGADVPCAQGRHDVSLREWQDAYYGQQQEDPDEDLVRDLVEHLRSRGISDRRLGELEEGREKEVPAANTVSCPLRCYQDDESPPCAYSLRNRVKINFSGPQFMNYSFEPIPFDPDDIVIKSDFIPCVYLGRELLRGILPGLFAGGQQADGQADDETDAEAEEIEDQAEEIGAAEEPEP